MTNKKTSSNKPYELLGWLGVVLVTASYALIASGVIGGNSILYHALVLTGSTLVAVISYKKRVFQPVVLNVTFALFAIVALVRITSLNW